MKWIALVLALAAAAHAEPGRMTLAEAVELALQVNPSATAALHDKRAAEARIAQVRAGLLPRIDAQFVAQRVDTTSALTTGGVRSPAQRANARVDQAPAVALRQLVTDFGRTIGRVRAAEDAAESAASDRRTADLDIAVNVKVAFHGLVAAQRRFALARVAIGQRTALLETSRQLVEQAIRSRFDVTRAELALADAQVQERQARLALDTARQDLLTAIGTPDLPAFEGTDELEATTVFAPFAESGAVAARPELESAAYRVRAQEKLYSAARAEYRPVISGVASFVDRSTDSANRSLDEREGAVVAQVDLPVFHGFQIKGQVDEARDNVVAERARQESLRQAIVRDVRTAALNHEAARDRIALVRKLVAAAEDNVGLVNERYRSGFSTIIEVIDAQTSLTAGQFTLIDAYLAERVAAARRERSLGRR